MRRLESFLRAVADIDDLHLLELAPTEGLLDPYKKGDGSWAVYKARFLELMARRRIEETLAKDVIHESCLLCSEDKAHHCHCKLVAEYLSRH